MVKKWFKLWWTHYPTTGKHVWLWIIVRGFGKGWRKNTIGLRFCDCGDWNVDVEIGRFFFVVISSISAWKRCCPLQPDIQDWKNKSLLSGRLWQIPTSSVIWFTHADCSWFWGVNRHSNLTHLWAPIHIIQHRFLNFPSFHPPVLSKQCHSFPKRQRFGETRALSGGSLSLNRLIEDKEWINTDVYIGPLAQDML